LEFKIIKQEDYLSLRTRRDMVLEKKLFLFDVDNTLAHSGEKISDCMLETLQQLKEKGYELGIVGGGTHSKIFDQLGDGACLFRHIFSECGCVYYRDGSLHQSKDLRNDHPRARAIIDTLIKKALGILAEAPYPLGGHMIDVRTGIVYISCVGMTATKAERRCFLEHHLSYREYLMERLRAFLLEKSREEEIEIRKGGSVGIALFPRGWDKSQIIAMLPSLETYQEIWYFGDSTGPDGNDESLLRHASVTHPMVVLNPEDTLSKLASILV
jgi:HAD superfamily hydrolase (TIGR01484 family)